MGVFSKNQAGAYRAKMSPLVESLLKFGWHPERVEKGVWKIGPYLFKSGWKLRQERAALGDLHDNRP